MLPFAQQLFTPVPLENGVDDGAVVNDTDGYPGPVQRVDEVASVGSDEEPASMTSLAAPTSTASEGVGMRRSAREVSTDVLKEAAAAGAAVDIKRGAAAIRRQDPVREVSLGGSHSLVRTASGRVFGFGRTQYGRLGVADDGVSTTRPSLDLQLLVGSREEAVGFHRLALKLMPRESQRSMGPIAESYPTPATHTDHARLAAETRRGFALQMPPRGVRDGDNCHTSIGPRAPIGQHERVLAE